MCEQRASGRGREKGQIAGAAAEIEDARVRAAEDFDETLRGAATPDAVHRERQKMIQKVVARDDAGEHIADARGGFALVMRTFGASTGERGGFLSGDHRSKLD